MLCSFVVDILDNMSKKKYYDDYFMLIFGFGEII